MCEAPPRLSAARPAASPASAAQSSHAGRQPRKPTQRDAAASRGNRRCSASRARSPMKCDAEPSPPAACSAWRVAQSASSGDHSGLSAVACAPRGGAAWAAGGAVSTACSSSTWRALVSSKFRRAGAGTAAVGSNYASARPMRIFCTSDVPS
jgi:hypothetical protein